jgi:MoxR-like ATPase
MDDQRDVSAALGIAVAARVPVLLWGAPGTGKTSAVRALAATAG